MSANKPQDRDSCRGVGNTFRSELLLALAVILVPGVVMAGSAPDVAGASWIWASPDGRPLLPRAQLPCDTAHLRQEFEIPAGAEAGRAVLTLVADNAAEAWVNGSPAGKCAHWKEPLVADVTALLHPGRNVLAILATNTPTPGDAGGALAKLAIGFRDGTALSVVTDGTWRGSPGEERGWEAEGFIASGWPRAGVLGPVGLDPWGIEFPGAEVALQTAGPQFLAGPDDARLALLSDLLTRHFTVGVSCTLWDPWLPQAQLWAGVGGPDFHATYSGLTRLNLLGKTIEPSGYVSMQQHRGLGHADGWPFPLWTQSGGIGWHFSLLGNPFGERFDIRRTAEVSGWELQGAKTQEFDEKTGWVLELDSPDASVATPAFQIPRASATWVRLEWRVPGGAAAWHPRLQWTTAGHPEFDEERSMDVAELPSGDGLVFSMVPIYRLGGDGPVTRFRICFGNPGPAEVRIAALFTTTDSRKPVTNPDYVIGCTDYAAWTRDIGFLRANLPRMRMALGYAIREFRVDELGFARVPWPGHEGRSGLVWNGDSPKQRPGEGIGNNYFDLIPFGGDDFYLTVRIHLALRRMAALERLVAAHPQWNLPGPEAFYRASEIEALISKIEKSAREHFWNPKTGRFAASVDADGRMHDYGFTAVNLEAVANGLTSGAQARKIFQWLDGRRTVAGDTSQGADIYHWRLSPRMTTRRNLDYYSFVWVEPHRTKWGDQVQDGGAVLGFSYYDILARIRTLGPDAGWKRLSEILDWYREVREAGGYRKYYTGRDGTLQGGGTAGGIGVDNEFSESVMVPSVMVYGFLGARPSADQIEFAPRLPAGWPQLTVTDMVHGSNWFDVTARPAEKLLSLRVTRGDPAALRVTAPAGWKVEIAK